jgi:hypothetical protein
MTSWKKEGLRIVAVLGLLLLLAMVPGLAGAAEGGSADAAAVAGSETGKPAVDEEALARLLAPIALYPDTLLMQMFMASTYPLEIVEAARFMKKHPEMKDDALDKALEKQEWDDSVKSLCHFPSILKQMNEHLDATKQLGDFFLADQKAVLDMVQTLRRKAQEKGELKSTKQQKVVVEEKTIIIQPTNPEVIYVPSYNPTVVYGTWWYPSPPYVWYPPPPIFSFAAGVAVGVWASGWCHANWARGRVDIDIDRNININRPGRPGGGRPRDRMARAQAWKHNPKHRRGVAYRNRDVRQRYGQSARRARQRDLARGYGGKMNRQTRERIQRQGLKNNGRFGEGVKRQGRSATGLNQRRPRNSGRVSSGIKRQPRTSSRSNGRISSGVGRSRNRATTTRTPRRSVNRSRSRATSSSAFRRSRSASRSSARGRSSRSFSRRSSGGRSRGGGRSFGGRRR